jgi:hypothetical protein
MASLITSSSCWADVLLFTALHPAFGTRDLLAGDLVTGDIEFGEFKCANRNRVLREIVLWIFELRLKSDP